MNDFIATYLRDIIMLEKKVGTKTSYSILEPFYVNGRDIISIQNAGKKIANFIGLSNLTFIIANVKLKEGGNIELGYENEVYINISDSIVDFDEVVLATLAHEITHKYMQINNISFGTNIVQQNMNEILTDVTAVFLGLGKLMLNGYKLSKTNYQTNEITTLKSGYISLNQLAFVYRLVCSMRKIPYKYQKTNLSKTALHLFNSCNCYSKDYFNNEHHLEEIKNNILKDLSINATELQNIRNQINQVYHVMLTNIERKQKFINSLQCKLQNLKEKQTYDPCLRFLDSVNIKNWGIPTIKQTKKNIKESNKLKKKLLKIHNIEKILKEGE